MTTSIFKCVKQQQAALHHSKGLDMHISKLADKEAVKHTHMHHFCLFEIGLR
jgi:hypothetical protein